MQTTPNLGLPQFEPTDKYRLEDYNEAYAKIDEKIKEAQDLIATWTQFKSNGGEIGGVIGTRAVNTPEVQIHDRVSDDAFGFIEENNILFLARRHKGTWAENPLAVTFDNVELNRNLVASYTSKALGEEARPWKDIYLSGVSKNANGYTKLPNGMIMQWGKFTLDIPSGGMGENIISLPIRFSQDMFVANITTSYNITDNNYNHIEEFVVTSSTYDLNSIKVKSKHVVGSFTGTKRIQFQYTVLGY